MDTDRLREELTVGTPVIWVYDCDENYTRYTLVFTPLDGAVGDRLPGCPGAGWVMVSWERRGAYPFSLLNDGSYFDVTYVMEKFNCNEATAQPLADIFNKVSRYEQPKVAG